MERKNFMRTKLLTHIACALLFASVGFASEIYKIDIKNISRIPSDEASASATDDLANFPEVHIMHARDQIIDALQTKLIALQAKIKNLDASINAIESARATRPAIQTISFADLKKIVADIKAAR